MAPITRSRSQKAKDALEHVLKILENKKFQEIFAEAGISDMDEFLMVEIDDLKEVTPINERGNLIKLNLVEIGKLKKLSKWYELQEQNDPDVWWKFTTDSLTQTLNSLFIDSKPEADKSTSVKSQGILSGVKRTITEYPRLRDDKMWMSFNRTVLALAATHDLSEVFDPAYVPLSGTENVFKQKNLFVYSVFTYALVTAKSKVPLRAYEKNMDGQAVYRALLSAYSDGTSKNLSAESLENQLRGMKLDSTWSKSYETFLHTWSTRLYDLESIRDEEVSYNDKKRWLINSIKSNAALYQGVNTAKSVEQTVKAMAGGKELIWEQFFNLILDHAQNLDSTMPTTTRRRTN